MLELENRPDILAMSEETLMIFPCLLLERAGRKYFDVKKGP